MSAHYETLKLEKGMYGQAGRSFTQVLEDMDPSEIDPKNLVAFIREATKLERENRRLRMEVDVLKQAALIFARK